MAGVELITVETGEAGMRLDRWFKAHFPGLGFVQLQKLLRSGQVRVDGGAAANDLLMQFQADILDVPVERPQIIETTALGAACLAGLAVGVWKNRESLAGQRKVDRRFKPQMTPEGRDRLYGKWKKAVARSAAAAGAGGLPAAVKPVCFRAARAADGRVPAKG